jgi:hypothetical protein
MRSAGIVSSPLTLFADKLISIRALISDRDDLEALVDPGSYLNLIDAVLAKELGLEWKPLPRRIAASAANGSTLTMYGVSEVSITLYDAKGQLRTETVPFLVTDLRKYPIYLGMPWVSDVNPMLDYKKKELIWRPQEEVLLSSFVHIDVEPSREFKQTVLSGTADLYIMHVSSVRNTHIGRLPKEYRDFEDITSEDTASQLPQHGPQDLAIELEPETKPPFSPLYNMSETELAALRKYITEFLDRGWIRRSRSPAGAPVLFAKKKDGSLRLCVDYRGLNKITKKNRHPLPLISESLARLGRARYYTRIDIRDAYHRLRIRQGDE